MNEVNETAYHANETLFIGGESDHEPVVQKRPRSGSFPKFISEAFPSPPSLAFRMSDEDSTDSTDSAAFSTFSGIQHSQRGSAPSTQLNTIQQNQQI